jgi:hypothetical protein
MVIERPIEEVFALLADAPVRISAGRPGTQDVRPCLFMSLRDTVVTWQVAINGPTG